jgi:sec-independent protein translocase protein TatA
MNLLASVVFGGWQVLLVLGIVLIFFGARKIPELAKGLGQGIKEFKKATHDGMEDKKSVEEKKP